MGDTGGWSFPHYNGPASGGVHPQGQGLRNARLAAMERAQSGAEGELTGSGSTNNRSFYRPTNSSEDAHSGNIPVMYTAPAAAPPSYARPPPSSIYSRSTRVGAVRENDPVSVAQGNARPRLSVYSEVSQLDGAGGTYGNAPPPASEAPRLSFQPGRAMSGTFNPSPYINRRPDPASRVSSSYASMSRASLDSNGPRVPPGLFPPYVNQGLPVQAPRAPSPPPFDIRTIPRRGARAQEPPRASLSVQTGNIASAVNNAPQSSYGLTQEPPRTLGHGSIPPPPIPSSGAQEHRGLNVLQTFGARHMQDSAPQMPLDRQPRPEVRRRRGLFEGNGYWVKRSLSSSERPHGQRHHRQGYWVKRKLFGRRNDYSDDDSDDGSDDDSDDRSDDDSDDDNYIGNASLSGLTRR
ncbi:MAG: hypothetical protein M1825_005119 [Sarcosagium campestre]|nr:MAG: hypothetical protein M1825_005119 [Sarcosagium campestre]